VGSAVVLLLSNDWVAQLSTQTWALVFVLTLLLIFAPYCAGQSAALQTRLQTLSSRPLMQTSQSMAAMPAQASSSSAATHSSREL
jgi:hypothetical protein